MRFGSFRHLFFAAFSTLLLAAAPGRAPAVEPAVLESFRECATCPEMVALPAGAFTMGAREGEPWADKQEEGPRRLVEISAFALSATEITFAQWEACLADGGCRGHRPEDEGWGRGARPVIHVSRHDAEAFADWLNSKVDGAPYRLPSEAEWEYAARAETKTPFWFGGAITPEDANYNTAYAYGGGPKSEPLWRTAPVKSYPPNPWGLYEMTGNVWEWTADCWHWSYRGAPIDGSPRRTGDCDEAPMRGGSYDERPFHLRSANRLYLPAKRRKREIGFRIARDLPQRN